MENGMYIIGLAIGLILMLIGIFSIKRSSKGWNLIDLILNRQGSGIGQLLSGILLIAAVIALFFMQRSGIL